MKIGYRQRRARANDAWDTEACPPIFEGGNQLPTAQLEPVPVLRGVLVEVLPLFPGDLGLPEDAC